MTTFATFDLKQGDAVVCRDGRFEFPFQVKSIERGHVSVDLGGIAMPLPLRALDLGREPASV
jgi:hypothetical protein